MEGSTYPVKSRSSLISAHSAVTVSNRTSLDNRLPRETWSHDPHSVSHRHLSPEMLDRAGFCSEDSVSKRPGTAPAMRKSFRPTWLLGEADLSLKAFEPDDVLVG